MKSILYLIVFFMMCSSPALYAEQEVDTAASSQEDSDRAVEAKELLAKGHAAFSENEHHKAASFYTQALAFFQQTGNVNAIQNTLEYMALAYLELSQYNKALECIDTLLEIAQKRGDTLKEGRMNLLRGQVYHSQIFLLKALDEYQHALTLFENAHQAGTADVTELTAVTLANIANAYSDLGRFRDAVRVYDRSLGLAEVRQDLSQQGEILRDLGTTYLRIGHYPEALKTAHDALNLFKDPQVNSRKNQAYALATIGAAYESLGDLNPWYFFKALQTYERALAIQKERKDSREIGLLLNNRGKALAHLGNASGQIHYHKQALKDYEQALGYYEIDQAKELIGRTKNNIGESLLALSRFDNSAERISSAEEALISAREVQETLRDHRRLWISYSNLGRVYEWQGKHHDALRVSQRSIEIFEELIASSAQEEFTISLREQIAETYERSILLLMETGQPEQAFLYSEQARARAFLDMLGQKRADIQNNFETPLHEERQNILETIQELKTRLQHHAKTRVMEEKHDESLIRDLEQELKDEQEKYAEILSRMKINHPEYASLSSVTPLELRELQALLDERSTLLSYFVTPRKSLAFVIAKNRFQAVEISVSKAELYAHIRNARQIAVPEQAYASLEYLHEQLIEPLRPYLETPSVGILPHSILHYLPFAALKDEHRYFGDRYQIYTLPSASVLAHLPRKKPAQNIKVLALANTSTTGDLAALPFVKQEVEAIDKRFETNLLQDEKATETTLKTEAGRYHILHLAAHGELNVENPLFSSIRLYEDELNDGRLEVHDVYSLHLEQNDLVVLSACDTLLGKQSRGDDIIGLTQAFLYAKTPSVIATLWQVNDRASAEFMANFYTFLSKGKGKAEALQLARRKTRKTYPHPYYWAGFVLTGDPGALLEKISPIEMLIAVFAAIGIFLLLRAMKVTGPAHQDSP